MASDSPRYKTGKYQSARRATWSPVRVARRRYFRALSASRFRFRFRMCAGLSAYLSVTAFDPGTADLAERRCSRSNNCPSRQVQIPGEVVKISCHRLSGARKSERRHALSLSEHALAQEVYGLAVRHGGTLSSDAPIPANLPAQRNACELVWRGPPTVFACKNARHGRLVHFCD